VAHSRLITKGNWEGEGMKTLKQGNIVYELKGGFGSWAVSREHGIKIGTVRLIGDLLMSAWQVRDRMFSKPEVLWTPVDKEICHDAGKLREWSGRVS
jgi:hypothetical protein